jgi:hypothetical protein
MVTGAAYYEAVLGALYDAIEDMDVTAYRDPTTAAGRWKRARRATPDHGITSDLGFWIDLGNHATFERSQVTHAAGIVFALRYRPDHDLSDQARVHAATRALEEMLQGTGYQIPGGMRTIPRTATQSLPATGGDAWIQIDLSFTLILPRGA